MRIARLLLPLVAATLLAACGSSGTYYEKSPKAVQQALRVQDLPLAVLGSTVKGKRVTSPDDETVVIALLGPEQIEIMRFVVTVKPDGTGSRVAVAVRPPEGSKKAKAEEAMKRGGLAMGLMGTLANEHVAAAIEGRPFNMMFATGPIGKGVAAASPEMGAAINNANQAASVIAKMEREAEFSSEYGEDWASPE